MRHEATILPLKEVGRFSRRVCHVEPSTQEVLHGLELPPAIIPQASSAERGRRRMTCHPQPPSCHRGGTAPSCRQALQFSENSVPHHSRLVTNSFLPSCITYTTERKGRLFLGKKVSLAPLSRAAERRSGEERRVWEEKGGHSHRK